jgi:hypothetical protein
VHKPYSKVKRLVKTNPLPLAKLSDKRLINLADSFLPVDTGIEIECNFKNGCNQSNFNISGLIQINCDKSEQRFRIPPGIKGLICLYELCEQLKLFSELNPKSGIHYHVDFTEHFDKVDDSFLKENEKQIVQSLDSWDYIGNYNKKKVSFFKTSWVRFHKSLKTIEFRIGEMSFDYELLVKRIIHCHKIRKELVNKLTNRLNREPTKKEVLPF